MSSGSGGGGKATNSPREPGATNPVFDQVAAVLDIARRLHAARRGISQITIATTSDQSRDEEKTSIKSSRELARRRQHVLSLRDAGTSLITQIESELGPAVQHFKIVVEACDQFRAALAACEKALAKVAQVLGEELTAPTAPVVAKPKSVDATKPKPAKNLSLFVKQDVPRKDRREKERVEKRDEKKKVQEKAKEELRGEEVAGPPSIPPPPARVTTTLRAPAGPPISSSAAPRKLQATLKAKVVSFGRKKVCQGVPIVHCAFGRVPFPLFFTSSPSGRTY